MHQAGSTSHGDAARAADVERTDDLMLLGACFLQELRQRGLEPAGEGEPPLESLREMEARHITRALARTGGHIGAAARILGVHRNTLTRKIRRLPLAGERGAA